MDLDDELEAWLRLSLTKGLSAAQFRQLLVAFGGPQQILAASRGAVSRIVPEAVARSISGAIDAEAMRAVGAWLNDPSNGILTLGDTSYPQSLLNIADPPPLIYATGRVDLLNAPAIAIVGSRNATRQGIAHAESFAQALSDAGLTIVSGLAVGIDAAAHRGGLSGRSSSIAVVGTGLDSVYPARNCALARALAASGCLISEFPLGTPPTASNFPRRNRIISALGRGCLVVEAALPSGSLITARTANEQGKDVFAIPGSIDSPLSKGCHSLIKQGAKLVESADDILEEFEIEKRGRPATSAQSSWQSHPLLELIGFEPCDIETLVRSSGLDAATVSSLLAQWEIEGLVEALPGARYQRIR